MLTSGFIFFFTDELSGSRLVLVIDGPDTDLLWALLAKPM